ncbi:MAG: hypothetical protein ACK53Y_02805, partial [bacterium]
EEARSQGCCQAGCKARTGEGVTCRQGLWQVGSGEARGRREARRASEGRAAEAAAREGAAAGPTDPQTLQGSEGGLQAGAVQHQSAAARSSARRLLPRERPLRRGREGLCPTARIGVRPQRDSRDHGRRTRRDAARPA